MRTINIINPNWEEEKQPEPQKEMLEILKRIENNTKK